MSLVINNTHSANSYLSCCARNKQTNITLLDNSTSDLNILWRTIRPIFKNYVSSCLWTQSIKILNECGSTISLYTKSCASSTQSCLHPSKTVLYQDIPRILNVNAIKVCISSTVNSSKARDHNGEHKI